MFFVRYRCRSDVTPMVTVMLSRTEVLQLRFRLKEWDLLYISLFMEDGFISLFVSVVVDNVVFFNIPFFKPFASKVGGLVR